MTDSNPTGKVRPMSDQEPPNAAESSGSGPNVRLRAASPTARTLRALPHAVTRRMIGLQQPGSGESRLNKRSSGGCRLISRCSRRGPRSRLENGMPHAAARADKRYSLGLARNGTGGAICDP
jgi:hypothetical protein